MKSKKKRNRRKKDKIKEEETCLKNIREKQKETQIKKEKADEELKKLMEKVGWGTSSHERADAHSTQNPHQRP